VRCRYFAARSYLIRIVAFREVPGPIKALRFWWKYLPAVGAFDSLFHRATCAGLRGISSRTLKPRQPPAPGAASSCQVEKNPVNHGDRWKSRRSPQSTCAMRLNCRVDQAVPAVLGRSMKPTLHSRYQAIRPAGPARSSPSPRGPAGCHRRQHPTSGVVPHHGVNTPSSPM